MRFHVVGLPHTETTREYEWCAYTAKTRKFADMMTMLGHQVILYAGPKNEADCIEHVCCVDELPPNGEIPEFTEDNFAEFNKRALMSIAPRLRSKDLVCLIGGSAQALIANALPEYQIVEYGIGYGGIISHTYHVYESYAWMHMVLGSLTRGNAHNSSGAFFDDVIPNYFDIKDFDLGKGDGEYLLYVGRLTEQKGIQIAIEIAEHMRIPLKVAGEGNYPLPDWVDYVGRVGPQERSELMGGAIALLAPTLYIEPFGGVAVEAQLCGTPAITTDWGAFTETVPVGSGFRCRTMQEFANAVNSAPSLDRQSIRSRAQEIYSLESIGERYEKYFARLLTLWGDGFYSYDKPQLALADYT